MSPLVMPRISTQTGALGCEKTDQFTTKITGKRNKCCELHVVKRQTDDPKRSKQRQESVCFAVSYIPGQVFVDREPTQRINDGCTEENPSSPQSLERTDSSGPCIEDNKEPCTEDMATMS